MTRTRSPRYTPTTQREENFILHIGHQVSDLFDEKEIEDFMATARHRIIGEFHYAMETNPRFKPGSDRRRKRRTDNYILGLKRRPSDLARYVVRTMHRPFIKASQLPLEFQGMRPSLVDAMLQRAQYDIVLAAVQSMLCESHEIWYDEGIGIWQVCQSSVDQFLDYKHIARTMVKDDKRNYHGRVRSHSKQRGVPAGTSVSLA